MSPTFVCQGHKVHITRAAAGPQKVGLCNCMSAHTSVVEGSAKFHVTQRLAATSYFWLWVRWFPREEFCPKHSICVRVQIYTCKETHAYPRTHVHTCARARTHTTNHQPTHIHTHTHTSIPACTCTLTHSRTHTHAHPHTHT